MQECIAKTFLGEKDKVVLVSPTYDNFRSTAEATGARALFFKLDDNKEFNIEKFIKFTSNQKNLKQFIFAIQIILLERYLKTLN